MALSDKNHLVTGLAFNKLADLLVSAKSTLPALLLMVGAPAWMIGWLVPIRESGALLPQAAIGVLLRRYGPRHPVWRLGMSVQIASVLMMILSAVVLSSSVAGWVILIALVCLSVGRSACSLTFKDIEASVAAKGERGRLIGIASTVSGVVTLVVAVPLLAFSETLGNALVICLLALASLSFGMSLAFIFPLKTTVDTKPEEQGSRLWQFDSVVYRFVAVRGLFVHSALVAPYFMLESGYDAQQLLPLYLAAQAGASMLSSMVWGTLADRSAVLTLRLSGVLALFACGGLLLLDVTSLWLSGALFFVLSVAHAGVRTGRKTYSLDVKEGQSRTELVAFSNTAIGIVLLCFGGLYAALTPLISFSVVYVMAAMLLAGLVLTVILPNEKETA